MNAAIYAMFPLVGAVLIQSVAGPDVAPRRTRLVSPRSCSLVFMVTNSLNFSIVAGFNRCTRAHSVLEAVRSIYVNLLPSEFATALLTAGVAFSYGQIGVGAVGLAAVVLFIFQYLFRTGIQALERGEELENRTRELASLQVGLLSTVLQTLSMRDAMTARHSAAVARYAARSPG